MELLGPKNLTNSELLAIIIKNGTKKINCVEIAQNIFMSKKNISNMSDLEYLNLLSIEELKTFEGIGKVKAIQIKAALELASRLSSERKMTNKYKVVSPQDVFELVESSYLNTKNEVLKVILLNKQNKVLSVVDSLTGQIDRIEIDIKQVLSEPIKQMANGIILCHNHPGGSLKPSKHDINFTKKMFEYCKIFNINLLDHIIIADNNYVSMKQLGSI